MTNQSNPNENQKIVTQTVIVANEKGLHVRPCYMIADAARKYQSNIEMQCEDRIVNANSVLDLLRIQAPHGSSVTIRIVGIDAEEAMSEIKNLIESVFSF